jgi:Serine carboxypeptidase S28
MKNISRLITLISSNLMLISATMNFIVLFVVIFVEISTSKIIINQRNHLKLERLKKLSEPPISHDRRKFAVEKWIEQPLDHFNSQDQRTFDQRYYENIEYLIDNGPIFIFVGGEAEMSGGWILAGHFHDMAKQLNGILFSLEHRYYGKTQPTSDLSVENLRYLTSEQALADLAHFIVKMKEINPKLANTSGVILFGGSYSASLVTWFIQKYPHLVSGVWASSGPIIAQVDFPEYFQTVAEMIELIGGPECARKIKSANDQLEKWVVEGNASAIEENMLLCYPLDLRNPLDISSMFIFIPSYLAGVVQSHKETNQDIQRECTIITESGIENDVFNYVNWLFRDYFERGIFDICIDHRYSSELDFFVRNEWSDWTDYLGWRQWRYQTCAEFAWFQTSGNETIFGSSFPADSNYKLCNDAYGGV